jgi:hypothetical protein
MYRQQWQADQHKNVIYQKAGNIPSKSKDEKRKKKIIIIRIPMEDVVMLAKAILDADDADDMEEAVVNVVEEETIVSI